MMIKKGKLYVVFGGTGFLGRYITNHILKCGGRVLICSRDGEKFPVLVKFLQENLGTLFNKHNVSYQQVDLLRIECFENLFNLDIDGIFNCTGYQNNRLAEVYQNLCYSTNVEYSLKILQFAEQQKINFVVGFSAIRAEKPNNVYGYCKKVQEQMYLLKNNKNYKCIRLGNIVDSDFSVFKKWKNQLQDRKKIKVTSLGCTRFLMNKEQFLHEIFNKMFYQDKIIYCPSMKAASLAMIYYLLARRYKKFEGDGFFEVGLFEGEALHDFYKGVYSSSMKVRMTMPELEKLFKD